MRYPVLTQTLRLIRQVTPEAVQTVIDIGVQHKTEFLMNVFPDKLHYLFEPTTIYHKGLEATYNSKGIQYELHKVALSDQDGVIYLHNQSIDGSGRVTHAQIRSQPDEKMRFLTKIEEVPMRRLDSVFASAPFPDMSYIVKLDVDGVEEKIIAGGQEVLKSASFVIIETSLGRQDICSRAALFEALGFRIFDICDNAYYFGQLALVDLVLINNRLRASEVRYRPWEYSKGLVIWPKWQHGFRHLEDEELDNFFD